jgi:hypothetical protein
MKRKFWILIFLAATLVGLVALSSGISDIELSSEWRLYDFDDDEDRAGSSTANEIFNRLPRLPQALWQVLSVVLIILIPMAIIVALFSPEIRKSILQEFKRAVPFVVMAVAILYLINRIQLENLKPPGSNLMESPPDMPSWINNPTIVVAFLIGLVMVSLIFLTSYLIWQRSKIQPLNRIAEEAQVAVDQLRAGVDYKNAIIQCYVHMCEVLKEHQRIERKHSMTAREFAHRLENLGISGWHAYRLTYLFEDARYGALSAKKEEEQEAIECLTAIAALAERKAKQPISGPDWKFEF